MLMMLIQCLVNDDLMLMPFKILNVNLRRSK